MTLNSLLASLKHNVPAVPNVLSLSNNDDHRNAAIKNDVPRRSRPENDYPLGTSGTSFNNRPFQEKPLVHNPRTCGTSQNEMSGNQSNILGKSSSTIHPLPSLSRVDEEAIRGYLWRTGENREYVIDGVIDQCKRSPERQLYYLDLDHQEREAYANRLPAEDERIIRE